MDYLTVALLVLVAVLAVVALFLGWRLARGKHLPFIDPPPVVYTRRTPTHVKCNAKHFIFKRTDETGAEVQADVWRHQFCEQYPDEHNTDEFQAASFLAGHPGQGWQHTETRGEVHFVKAS